MTVLKKRALSSAGSLARSLARRLECLGQPEAAEPVQLELTLASREDEDAGFDARDDEPSTDLDAEGFADEGRERAWLARLHEAALAASRSESKLAALRRMLHRTTEPVIVFTEYRDTLLRIAAGLRSSSPALLHGALAPIERRAAISDFINGRARVLLATDAAGEGLNLQQRCRWVINYELPWNPMRLEQRIGRVDRIGQRRRVHAVHLLARRTSEYDVLGHLVRRLERIRASIGTLEDEVLGHLPADLVAYAMIHGQQLAMIENRARTAAGAFPAARTDSMVVLRFPERASDEVKRLHEVRRLSGAGGQKSPRRDPLSPAAALLSQLDLRAPWVTVLRAGPEQPLRPGVFFVYRGTIEDAAGRAIETVVTPVWVPTRDIQPTRPDDVRRSLVQLLELFETRAQASARVDLERRLAHIAVSYAEASRRGARRAAAVLAHGEARTSRSGVQASLFDRRAVRHALQQEASAALRQEEIVQTIDSLEAGARLSIPADPQLVLILIVAP